MQEPQWPNQPPHQPGVGGHQPPAAGSTPVPQAPQIGAPPVYPGPASPGPSLPEQTVVSPGQPQWSSPTAELGVPAGSSGGGSRLGLIFAGIMGLAIIAGGGFFAWNALSETGGADTPEAAVRAIYEAIDNEDFVTVAELIEPAERRTLVEPALELASEMQRLGLLAETEDDTDPIPGFDLGVTDLELRTELIADDIARVHFEGGTVTGSVEGADLPWGPVILDRLGADERSELENLSESTSESIDPETLLVTVERDGRWYVSLWYLVAEAARDEAGRAYPVSQSGPEPNGADTPGRAVQNLFVAMVDLDLEAMIASMDPEELAALYDYSPLFLDDAQDALAATREEVSIEIVRLETDELIDGDDAVVDLVGGEIAFDIPSENSQLTFEWTPLSFSVEGIVEGEPVGGNVTVDGPCVNYEITQNGETESGSECDEEVQEAFGSLTETGLRPQLRTHRVDGEWYVSPTSSIVQELLEQLQRIDRDELETWLDEVEEAQDDLTSLFDESIDLGFDIVDSGDTSIDVTPDPFASGATVVQGGTIDFQGERLLTESSLSEFGSEEWILRLDAGEIARISATGDLDTYLSLILDGQEVAYNDDFVGLDPQVAWSADSPQEIQIIVGNLGGAGQYTLVIEPGTEADVQATASSVTETLDWNGQETTFDTFVGLNDRTYSVSFDQEGDYRITVEPLQGDQDPAIWGWDETFELDLSTDDGGAGETETVTFTVDRPLSVELAVSDWRGVGGEMRVTIERVS